MSIEYTHDIYVQNSLQIVASYWAHPGSTTGVQNWVFPLTYNGEGYVNRLGNPNDILVANVSGITFEGDFDDPKMHANISLHALGEIPGPTGYPPIPATGLASGVYKLWLNDGCITDASGNKAISIGSFFDIT